MTPISGILKATGTTTHGMAGTAHGETFRRNEQSIVGVAEAINAPTNASTCGAVVYNSVGAMVLLVSSAVATANKPFESRWFGEFVIKVPSMARIVERSIDAQSTLYTVRMRDQNLLFIYVGTKPAFPLFTYGPPDLPPPVERDKILQSVRPMTIAGDPAQVARWTNHDGTHGRELLILPRGTSNTALHVFYNRLNDDARKLADISIDSARRK